MADREMTSSRSDQYPKKSWVWYAAQRIDGDSLDVDPQDVFAVVVCTVNKDKVTLSFTVDPTLPEDWADELQRVSEDRFFDALEEMGVSPSPNGEIPREAAMAASEFLWGSRQSLVSKPYSTLTRYLDAKQRDKIGLVFRRWGALRNRGRAES